MQRTVTIYPSKDNFQRTNDDVVPLNWAIGYLTELLNKLAPTERPTATVSGWKGVKVEATVTLTPMQILEERAAQAEERLRRIGSLLPQGNTDVTLSAAQVEMLRQMLAGQQT